MKPLGTNLERDIKESMFSYGPNEYRDYSESKAIIESEAEELELLNERIADVLKQFNISTVTWAIEVYEREVGVEPDNSKPLEQRKSVVISKMRGAGTTTKELVEMTAKAYSNGDVEVTEDNANYNVIIKFVSQYGIPSNMNDFESTLRSILPAHLGYTLQFRYLTWDELDSRNVNWNTLDALNLTWDEFEVWEME